jgi:hypothetical protein
MTNRKRNSEDTHVNPIDAVFNQTQEGDISRPESAKEVGFDVNADDLAHQPDSTSQEHSLDDTHETLTQDRFDKSDLLKVAEHAMKNDEQE